jgi:cell wall-associated NlpC family hydrolase
MNVNVPLAILLFVMTGCSLEDDYQEGGSANLPNDSIVTISSDTEKTVVDTLHTSVVNDVINSSSSSTHAIDSIVNFAETLIGTPYKYASADPTQGFDCSGFITYVFNHFDIKVPRSSIGFTNIGATIPVKEAKRGDLILFTGTDSTERLVGHMGIVVSNVNDSLQFIHSTSGRAYGVTITPLNDYYKGRFVKVVRI